MALELTKKVRYEASERLDLNDKLAEDSLLDETLSIYNQGLLSASVDGRIFQGWRTNTTTGPNAGLDILAEIACAIDRAGNVLIRDGVTAANVSLSPNSINYVYAYYEETESDVDNRRKYITGSEITDSINTRFTRTANFHTTTTAYGTGIPDFSDFAKTATILGEVRELIPLYAVAVDAGDTITRIDDYRPMWAPGEEGQQGGLYDVNGEPDFAHDFNPTDAPTLGITDIRTALVAITDRLKQLKGTTYWWQDVTQTLESVGDEWIRSGANIYRASGNVGIGVDPTAHTLDILNAQPRIRMRDSTDGSGNSYSMLESSYSISGNVFTISNYTSSSASIIRLDPLSSSNAQVDIFRNTNTASQKVLYFFRGDGSATPESMIGVDGTEIRFDIADKVGVAVGPSTRGTNKFQVTTAGICYANIASSTSGGTAVLRLGYGSGGNRQTSVDFISDDTSAYGLKVYRAAGVNADSYLTTKGVGNINITHEDAGGDTKFIWPNTTINFDVSSTAANNVSLEVSDSYSRWNQVTAGRPLILAYAGTNKIELATSGNITLTPSASVSLSGNLDVSGQVKASRSTTALLDATAYFTQLGAGTAVYIVSGSAGASDALFRMDRPANTRIFEVDSSGDIWAGGGLTCFGGIVTNNNTINTGTASITSGSLLATADETYDIGSSSNQWKVIHTNDILLYPGTTDVRSIKPSQAPGAGFTPTIGTNTAPFYWVYSQRFAPGQSGGDGCGGHWYPTDNRTYDIGSTSYRWADVLCERINARWASISDAASGYFDGTLQMGDATTRTYVNGGVANSLVGVVIRQFCATTTTYPTTVWEGDIFRLIRVSAYQLDVYVKTGDDVQAFGAINVTSGFRVYTSTAGTTWNFDMGAGPDVGCLDLMLTQSSNTIPDEFIHIVISHYPYNDHWNGYIVTNKVN